MLDFDVDLAVIGGGSGGVRAARVAATHGAKVLLAEEFRLGGTCVVRGCVPKKLFVYASRYRNAFEEAAEFGWTSSVPHFDWPTLVAAKDREVTRLEAAFVAGQKQLGVEVVKSRAVILDPHTVFLTSTGRHVRAKIILVATGAKPEISPFEGMEFGITSNEIFDLAELPKRLVVGGAGYIAVEFASLFAALGSDVTIVCKGDNVLRGFDEDLRQVLAASYRTRGIKLMFNDFVTKLESNQSPISPPPTADPTIRVTTHSGGQLVADQVLMAFGRTPNSAHLGLEDVGVDLSPDGAVLVDANSRTNVPSIYAVGDVTNHFNLTPVAIREGHAFADSTFGGKPWQVDYDLVPTAVFSSPEVGAAGLTEAQAREQFAAVDIYMTKFMSLKAIAAGNQQPTLLKLIVDVQSERILGIHLFAEDASEMIQAFAVALRSGSTIGDFMTTMAVHPTLGEELVTFQAPTIRYDRRESTSTGL